MKFSFALLFAIFFAVANSQGPDENNDVLSQKCQEAYDIASVAMMENDCLANLENVPDVENLLPVTVEQLDDVCQSDCASTIRKNFHILTKACKGKDLKRIDSMLLQEADMGMRDITRGVKTLMYGCLRHDSEYCVLVANTEAASEDLMVDFVEEDVEDVCHPCLPKMKKVLMKFRKPKPPQGPELVVVRQPGDDDEDDESKIENIDNIQETVCLEEVDPEDKVEQNDDVDDDGEQDYKDDGEEKPEKAKCATVIIDFRAAMQTHGELAICEEENDLFDDEACQQDFNTNVLSKFCAPNRCVKRYFKKLVDHLCKNNDPSCNHIKTENERMHRSCKKKDGKSCDSFEQEAEEGIAVFENCESTIGDDDKIECICSNLEPLFKKMGCCVDSLLEVEEGETCADSVVDAFELEETPCRETFIDECDMEFLSNPTCDSVVVENELELPNIDPDWVEDENNARTLGSQDGCTGTNKEILECSICADLANTVGILPEDCNAVASVETGVVRVTATLQANDNDDADTISVLLEAANFDEALNLATVESHVPSDAIVNEFEPISSIDYEASTVVNFSESDDDSAASHTNFSLTVIISTILAVLYFGY